MIQMFVTSNNYFLQMLNSVIFEYKLQMSAHLIIFISLKENFQCMLLKAFSQNFKIKNIMVLQNVFC